VITKTLVALLLLPLLQAGPAVSRIEVAGLKQAMDADAVLVVDVRDAAAYAGGHIAGAVSIPERELEGQLPRLKSAKRAIVTYCS